MYFFCYSVINLNNAGFIIPSFSRNFDAKFIKWYRGISISSPNLPSLKDYPIIDPEPILALAFCSDLMAFIFDAA